MSRRPTHIDPYIHTYLGFLELRLILLGNRRRDHRDPVGLGRDQDATDVDRDIFVVGKFGAGTASSDPNVRIYVGAFNKAPPVYQTKLRDPGVVAVFHGRACHQRM